MAAAGCVGAATHVFGDDDERALGFVVQADRVDGAWASQAQLLDVQLRHFRQVCRLGRQLPQHRGLRDDVGDVVVILHHHAMAAVLAQHQHHIKQGGTCGHRQQPPVAEPVCARVWRTRASAVRRHADHRRVHCTDAFASRDVRTLSNTSATVTRLYADLVAIIFSSAWPPTRRMPFRWAAAARGDGSWLRAKWTTSDMVSMPATRTRKPKDE